MRAHVIENGIVVNTIEVESLDFMPNLVSAESGGAIGDRYENGEFIKPEEPSEAAPEQCTRRQGLLALLSYGIKRSDIEAQIEVIADEMEREAAWIEYLADTWDLDNPRLQAMWAALGGTPEQLPELFRLAVTL